MIEEVVVLHSESGLYVLYKVKEDVRSYESSAQLDLLHWSSVRSLFYWIIENSFFKKQKLCKKKK